MINKITYIDEIEIKNKRVLVRVDFDVSFNSDHTIKDDTRIRQNLPTINYLLKSNNKLVCVAKLGRPKGRDRQFSLKPVAERLQKYLPEYKVVLVNDFLNDFSAFAKASAGSSENKNIFLLENIRFHPEEKKNDMDFAKKLASLGDVFVNDGFAVSHRAEASVVGIIHFLPSYGGLLLKKEVESIKKAINNPTRPVVAIIAGAKISTKMAVINKLLTIADQVIIGGAMANNFFKAQGLEIGKSIYETEFVEAAKKLIGKVILPIDCRTGKQFDQTAPAIVKKLNKIDQEDMILDIGPETEKKYCQIIAQAKTIIWNGPLGYFENPEFAKGSQAVYQAIINNASAVSIIGGGDTLTFLKDKKGQEKITHISTGGGAMLELIEKGTLPGLEALAQNKTS